jgi:hypothetical protein
VLRYPSPHIYIGVSSCVAVWSPCFICFRMEYNTYRSVLFRLNILCGLMAAVQVLASSWCFVVLQNRYIVDRNIENLTTQETEYDNRFEVLTNVWNLNGPVWCIGLLALVVLIAVAFTVRAIQNVDLVGAIRFLWVILWVIPLQVRNQDELHESIPRQLLYMSNALLILSNRSSGPSDYLIISTLLKFGSSFGGVIQRWLGFELTSVNLNGLPILYVRCLFILSLTMKWYVTLLARQLMADRRLSNVRETPLFLLVFTDMV